MQKSRSSQVLVAGLAFVAAAAIPASLYGQESGGPMFSTPASRSTTGTPILTNPDGTRKDQIIDSAGGGAPAATPTKPRAAVPSSAPPPRKTPTLEGGASKTHGAWSLDCLKDGRCQIAGQTVSPDGKISLVLALAYDAGTGATTMQMAVPLGVFVAEGVTIAIGDFQSHFPISRCLYQGCIVDGMVPPEMIEAMKKESRATVIAKAPPQIVEKKPAKAGERPNEATVKIELILDGFSAAYAALRKDEG
ncbi:Invasion protein B, involved in pathogenesis [Hartmannibacter diazotrophicus]|uniref:Invasion protein B, involved in pathogenesis n=1 Tax=Hartmannibacter diazotrophicus TaxID=1482074 RepID=A0A2C9DD23_9HYPH|nr:invasion associated locus B family protein [Hartmannibacter diazotrophicus]SON58133.1 Invasion protein B, involved in pathogenesis [Hartmannibacter diazotrophicus]